MDNERNEYSTKNADKLISDFKTNMLSNRYSPWLYTKLESMPMDMGYWIGYSVAKGVIEKGGSIFDLLTLDDAKHLFDQSGIAQ